MVSYSKLNRLYPVAFPPKTLFGSKKTFQVLGERSWDGLGTAWQLEVSFKKPPCQPGASCCSNFEICRASTAAVKRKHQKCKRAPTQRNKTKRWVQEVRLTVNPQAKVGWHFFPQFCPFLSPRHPSFFSRASSRCSALAKHQAATCSHLLRCHWLTNDIPGVIPRCWSLSQS